MTGFEIRGGRSVPTIDGVVICKEHEPMVLEAYIQDERKREEAIQRKRMEAASATWRALLKAIWSRMRVRANYGPSAAGPSSGTKRATFAPTEAACRPEEMHAALGQDHPRDGATGADALPASIGSEGGQEAQEGNASDGDAARDVQPSDTGPDGNAGQSDAPQRGKGRKGSARKGVQQPTAKRKKAGRGADQQQQQVERADAAQPPGPGNGVHVETEEI